MKANEAPEKIYCGNNGHGNLSYSNLPFPNAVEYTRTDAFIEKALEWIKENIRPYYHEVRYKYEDFEKYMEGE